MNIFARITRLERRHAPAPAPAPTLLTAPDEANTRRVVELLAAAYRRKHGSALPANVRDVWIAELSTPAGWDDFAQHWSDSEHIHENHPT